MEQIPSTVVIHWASPNGERTGEKVFSGFNKSTLDRAKRYETRLLNLGFSTACIAADEAPSPYYD